MGALGRRWVGLFAIMLSGIVAAAGYLHAASFDCAKAGNPTEQTVCADKTLSELDEELARYYESARRSLADGAKCLASDQRAWIKDARNACRADKGCLQSVYVNRLATLHALQPAELQLQRDLPQVPVLVTAVPPEKEAATSAGAGAGLLEVSGQLVWEHDDINNMGLAVKSDAGRVHVIVFDMDIGNSATHAVLRNRIEKEGTAAFLVRGVKAKSGGFAQDQCRFVYRRRH